MKKVFLMLTLLIFGLTSCGGNKETKDSKKLRVGLNIKKMDKLWDLMWI